MATYLDRILTVHRAKAEEDNRRVEGLVEAARRAPAPRPFRQAVAQDGLTVVAATLFSLLISFTLTPMLASRWLQAKDVAEPGQGSRQKGFYAVVERVYLRLLDFAMAYRWVVVATMVLVPDVVDAVEEVDVLVSSAYSELSSRELVLIAERDIKAPW